MEEAKIRKIENQLRQLLAQAELKQEKKQAAPVASTGVKVIRRRKGKPDFQID